MIPTQPPSRILRELLLAASPSPLVYQSGCASEPADPVDVITFFDTTPRTQGRMIRSGRYVSRPGVQVLVRGSDYAASWAVLSGVVAAIEAIDRQSITVEDEAYFVSSCSITSGPMSLGRVSEGVGYQFSVNVTLAIRQ